VVQEARDSNGIVMLDYVMVAAAGGIVVLIYAAAVSGVGMVE